MGKSTVNLVGKNFGKLKVLQFSHKDAHGNCYYICKCLCGTIKTIAGNHLTSGRVISCGCSKRKNQSKDACENSRQIINFRTLLKAHLEEMRSSAVYIIIDVLNEYISTKPEFKSIELVINNQLVNPTRHIGD